MLLFLNYISGSLSRYDVALATNALGAKNVVEFARKCQKIEVLLHVSTGEFIWRILF